MKALFYVRQKKSSMIASLFLILACLLIFWISFTSLVKKVEPEWYYSEWVENGDYSYTIEVLNEDARMPEINDLFIESGYIQWMGFAFLTICVLPVLWILKDYHITNSIRTIMRLPISPTWYYLDKLLSTLLFLAIYLATQYLTLFGSAKYYLGVYPEELRPTDVFETMWDQSPIRVFYSISDPGRFASVVSFPVLLPAAVILSVFAVKSGGRGVLSGIIAGAGLFSALIYMMELPISIWLTPLMTVTVIIAGIWHINKIKIT